MSVYAEWNDKRQKSICRIKFDVETDYRRTSVQKRPLWASKKVGETKLKIYDSAFDRFNKIKLDKVCRFGSWIFIDDTVTMPEIIAAVKEFMLEIYHADEQSLIVSVSL